MVETMAPQVLVPMVPQILEMVAVAAVKLVELVLPLVLAVQVS
jgi:hypothetical protein